MTTSGPRGDANADLAEVLLLSGQADEAIAALEQALDRYERKGIRHGPTDARSAGGCSGRDIRRQDRGIEGSSPFNRFDD